MDSLHLSVFMSEGWANVHFVVAQEIHQAKALSSSLSAYSISLCQIVTAAMMKPSTFLILWPETRLSFDDPEATD